MSNTSNVVLKDITDTYQNIVIKEGDKTRIIILSTEDTLDLSTLVMGDKKTELYIYAEALVLSDTLALKNGVIACNELQNPANAAIDLSGKPGTDNDTPINMTSAPGNPGGNGGNGGNLVFYTEQTIVKNVLIQASGGNGGKGQEGTDTSEGGKGGNGGNGGNVQFITFNPYAQFATDLENIYIGTNYASKKDLIKSYITQTKGQSDLTRVVSILQTALDNTKNIEDLNRAIFKALTGFEDLKEKLKLDTTNNIDVQPGRYGSGGTGKYKHVNGEDGKAGIANVVIVSSVDELASNEGASYMFAHPAQCAMLLEKAKLKYFNAYLTSSLAEKKEHFKSAAILLHRLMNRISVFMNLDAASALSKYYEKNENIIGSFGSIQSFKNIYQKATKLLDQLNSGQDYFGNSSKYVPLLSFETYEEILSTSIANFNVVETNYYDYLKNLKAQQGNIEDVKIARDRYKAEMSDGSQTISTLKSLLPDTAKIIDSYAITLPQKCSAVSKKIQSLKDAIQRHVDFNLDSFLSKLTSLAFAPESQVMWVVQGAGIISDAASKITDDKGISVEKNYLVKQVSELKDGISSLQEGTSVDTDGSITLDDPGAQKLIMLEDNFLREMDGFYELFNDELKELKDVLQDYVNDITARNNNVIKYNIILSELAKYYEYIDQETDKIEQLNDKTLKTLDPALPALTSFMAQAYSATRETIMETLNNVVTAFRFLTLSDTNPVAKAFGGTALPKIDYKILIGILPAIKSAWADAMEKFGTSLNPFPVHDEAEKEGIIFTIKDSWVLDIFKENKILTVPLAINSDDNIFSDYADVRLTAVRVIVKGAKIPADSYGNRILNVNIKHGGSETILSPFNDRFDFEHRSISTDFRYYVTEDGNFEKIFQDGKIGDLKHTPYALVGPFTNWTITLQQDVQQIDEVQIEFRGASRAIIRL